MDPEQEVREFQREYLDFLDDEVCLYTLLHTLPVYSIWFPFGSSTDLALGKI
jgi:hypothetical protein